MESNYVKNELQQPSTQNKPFLEKLFEKLIENQKFPNYQAERRIDIFINYFLERILTVYLDRKAMFVCPEFPLKKEGNKLSTKLDYLCNTTDNIVFVELKTDDSSLKISQAKRYLESKWETCLKELPEIIEGSTDENKIKYKKLMAAIQKMELNNNNPSIRTIYISPLPKKKSKFAKEINIIKSKKLSDLIVELEDEERIVYEHLCHLKYPLYIYEISQNN